MKIFVRMLAILAAALLVVGATVALVGAGSTNPARQPGGFSQGPGASSPSQPGAGFERGRPAERLGGHVASLFGAVEVLKNLGIIAIVVAAGTLAGRLIGWPGAQARHTQTAPKSRAPS